MWRNKKGKLLLIPHVTLNIPKITVMIIFLEFSLTSPWSKPSDSARDPQMELLLLHCFLPALPIRHGWALLPFVWAWQTAVVRNIMDSDGQQSCAVRSGSSSKQHVSAWRLQTSESKVQLCWPSLGSWNQQPLEFCTILRVKLIIIIHFY